MFEKRGLPKLYYPCLLRAFAIGKGGFGRGEKKTIKQPSRHQEQARQEGTILNHGMVGEKSKTL